MSRQGIRHGYKNALSVLVGKKHHWQFDYWMRMEQELEFRSAFYFVPRKGSLLEYATHTPDPFYDINSKNFKNLFSSLSDNGFEIGLHASYRAHESEENFYAEKMKLEKLCGQKIIGNRHHYWHLNPHDNEETLLMHEKIGLEYDASIFNEHFLGWKRGLCSPYYPFHTKSRKQINSPMGGNGGIE